MIQELAEHSRRGWKELSDWSVQSDAVIGRLEWLNARSGEKFLFLLFTQLHSILDINFAIFITI